MSTQTASRVVEANRIVLRDLHERLVKLRTNRITTVESAKTSLAKLCQVDEQIALHELVLKDRHEADPWEEALRAARRAMSRGEEVGCHLDAAEIHHRAIGASLFLMFAQNA